MKWDDSWRKLKLKCKGFVIFDAVGIFVEKMLDRDITKVISKQTGCDETENKQKKNDPRS